MEEWNDGILEYWNDEVRGKGGGCDGD